MNSTNINRKQNIYNLKEDMQTDCTNIAIDRILFQKENYYLCTWSRVEAGHYEFEASLETYST